MTIKDIKFMNGEGYLLKEMPLSLEECESQMKEIDYDHFMMHIAATEMKPVLKKLSFRQSYMLFIALCLILARFQPRQHC